ncbi:MAG: sigma-70 family RNA polymerase sigma factor [Bacteroidota bacterium]|nr:sigma-70 family RNA polymerase sigma factor [Bacteroidota bacterium]
MTERQLISDCQSGSRKAQKELYERFAGKMMGVCLRYCKDKETAKDLLHDGFLKIFSHIDDFEGKGSFEGWIRRIMVNTALEYIRKQADEGYSLDIEEAYSLTNGDYGVLEKLEAEELIQLIQKLPEAYRMVFNLFVVEGYSHKEIAQAMSITESSSRVYLTRAKQLLQEMLAAIK